MTPLWSKPSLSRDFALLVSSILFILSLISFYVLFQTYESHSERVYQQLENEATRIDRAMTLEIEHATYILQAMAHQISTFKENDYDRIAQLLRSYDTDTNNVFSWIDADQFNIVSSNKGVHPKVDVSDRDYVKKTITDPWKVQTGRPFWGRVSNKWVLPLAIGVTDSTGKYMGTVLISMDIDTLTREFRGAIKKSGIDFAIYNKTFTLLTRGDENGFMKKEPYLDKLHTLSLDEQSSGPLLRASLFSNESFYSYYSSPSAYPYVIVLGLNPKVDRSNMLDLLRYRIPPFLFMAVFICALLWMIRIRLIKPVIQLTTIAASVSRGEQFEALPKGGPAEVEILAGEIRKAADYIHETMRINEEQQNKNVTLKRGKEAAELSNRIKNEFISAMSHELRTPLNNIIGFSEIIKNEMYGPLANTQYSQYIQDIFRSSKHLESLVNDIMSLSIAEETLAEAHDKSADVRFIMNKCLRLLADRLQQRRITVETRIGPDLPRLVVDEQRLKQIFLNLIGNAAAHTPEGGSITVQAKIEKDSRQSDWLAISFIDYGSKSVFKDDSPTIGHNAGPSRRIDISGLRIPLTKALVAMHQATLDIVSPPGKPTVVTVRFPKQRIVY